jgi:hypothetical protein
MFRLAPFLIVVIDVDGVITRPRATCMGIHRFWFGINSQVKNLGIYGFCAETDVSLQKLLFF